MQQQCSSTHREDQGFTELGAVVDDDTIGRDWARKPERRSRKPRFRRSRAVPNRVPQFLVDHAPLGNGQGQEATPNFELQPRVSRRGGEDPGPHRRASATAPAVDIVVVIVKRAMRIAVAAFDTRYVAPGRHKANVGRDQGVEVRLEQDAAFFGVVGSAQRYFCSDGQ